MSASFTVAMSGCFLTLKLSSEPIRQECARSAHHPHAARLLQRTLDLADRDLSVAALADCVAGWSTTESRWRST